MSEPHQGKLRVVGKQIVIDHNTKSGPKPFPVRAKLSPELQALPDGQLNQLDVDYEFVSGQIEHVRSRGQAWQGPASAAQRRPATAPDRAPSGGGRERSGEQRARRTQRDDRLATQQTASPVEREFHNPYNFIPAPPRQIADPDLGDAAGAGHHYLDPTRWTGTLTVQLTTNTPLLLPDAARMWKDTRDHKTYPTRLASDGSPYLARTAVKGMLRSAYEAVTNSRMGVLQEHAERLACRMDAAEGLSLVPARVSGETIQLLLGETEDIPTRNSNGRWEIPRKLMYAGWLRMYRNPHRKLWGPSAENGRCVWAFITRWQHFNPGFEFWNVADLRDGTAPKPTEMPPDDRVPWDKARQAPSLDGHWVRGYVCITNQNIDRKHDERVFFAAEGHPKDAALSVPLTGEIRRQWQDLIRNYQSAHRERDIWQRRDNHGRVIPPQAWKGRDPGDTAWSRHIYEDGKPRRENGQAQPDASQLTDGALCYARVDPQGEGYTVRALYPVIIARTLFEASPSDLLHESLKPATDPEHLSPADRVFGWVNQDGPGAYRGNLRIGPGRGRAEDVVPFESAVPLAILGQPKPQQVRFYGAADSNGSPMVDRTAKDRGYRPGHGLRGRKVYPHHHGLPEGYWDSPWQYHTQEATGNWHQEYRRPRDASGDQQCDDQNHSITSWVKPDSRFVFAIHVTNLSNVELGALLWLLTLDPDHYFRLGGGKPLGFGSVRLDITELALRNGVAWQAYYQTFLEGDEDGGVGRLISEPTEHAALECKQEFEQAVARAYGDGKLFGAVPFIKAFLQACRGFTDGLPIHYPRVTPSPHPEGKNYEWFVRNESKDGRKLALPALHQPDPGLPLKP